MDKQLGQRAWTKWKRVLFVYKALLSIISHSILNPFLLEMPYALRYGRAYLKDQTILRWFLWPKYIVQVLETKIMILKKCIFYWNKILLSVSSIGGSLLCA